MKPLCNNWYCTWSEFLSYSSATHIRWMEISLNMETRQWKNSTPHFEAISESWDKVLHTVSSSVFEPRYLLNHHVFEWVTPALADKTAQFQTTWVEQFPISWLVSHVLSYKFSKITWIWAFLFILNDRLTFKKIQMQCAVAHF